MNREQIAELAAGYALGALDAEDRARFEALRAAKGLPPAPEGKAYELWAIAGTGAPVPAGVLIVDAKDVWRLHVASLQTGGAIDAFAVTLQPAGGLAAPSGSRYFVGKL